MLTPSFTATLVAMVRAVYHEAPDDLDPAPDAVARTLVPAPIAWAPSLLRPAWRRAPNATAWVLSALSDGYAEDVVLRSAAIDDAVRDAVARGATQLVILGAGLDARALRMPELAGVTVYEVDHAGTQAYKRARTRHHAPSAREVVFVPADFERDRLEELLERAGHDASARTVWLLEGVSMYLRPDALDETLAVVARRSAEGSRLVATYLPPEQVAGPKGRLLGLLASAIGEPLRGVVTPAAMEARLRARGLRVLEDTTTTEWAARYWPSRGVPVARPRERLLVAEARATGSA